MKILYLITLCFIGKLSLYAQTTVSYAYDAAGNRIERTIVLNTSQAKAAKTDSVKQKETAKEIIGDLKILIYPNPTRGQLWIEVTGFDPAAKSGLFVYNLSGSLVLSKNTVTGSDPLDLSAQ